MKIIKLLFAMVAIIFVKTAWGLTLTSAAFTEGGLIPEVYTCDGQNVAPDLNWSDVPPGTESFVLIVQDVDAPSGVFSHWVVFNIPGTARQWNKDLVKLPVVRQGNNSWGRATYNGPCPPPTNKVHHYLFTLYALNSPLDLAPGATADQVRNALRRYLLGEVTLIGIYQRSDENAS